MVYRIYVEKKAGLDNEAVALKSEISTFLGIKSVERVRILNRYDAEGLDADLFRYAVGTVFSEPQLDLTFTELDEMRKLCKSEETPIRDLCKIVDLYKYGIKENPWSTLSLSSLKTAKQDFEKRIKGQDTALERTLDVVKRAVTGMNGLNSSSTGKPKGVLFFAGPTGTGKTETAKALAEKREAAE